MKLFSMLVETMQMANKLNHTLSGKAASDAEAMIDKLYVSEPAKRGEDRSTAVEVEDSLPHLA